MEILQNKQENKKIAILYIATGQYFYFWKDFYESAKKYFLPKHDRHFFLWTDATMENVPQDVTLTFLKWRTWPYSTLHRYEIFLQKEKELLNFDYCYFFNANMVCLKEVDEDVFPIDVPFVAAENLNQPFMSSKNRLHSLKTKYWTNNPRSAAFVPFKVWEEHPDWSWLMGGFNGGKAIDWMHMSKILTKWIYQDKINHIKVKWNDEAYMNKYMMKAGVKRLSPIPYLSVWWRDITDEVKLRLLRKQDILGDDFRTSGRHIEIFTDRLKSLIE